MNIDLRSKTRQYSVDYVESRDSFHDEHHPRCGFQDETNIMLASRDNSVYDVRMAEAMHTPVGE